MAGGKQVSYSVVGNVLTASAGGETVFTLTVAADGSFSFELFRQLDHVDDGTNSANTALRLEDGGSVNSIDFSSIVLAGGTPLSSGFFSVTVVDATPSVSANATALLDDDALTGGNPGGTSDDVGFLERLRDAGAQLRRRRRPHHVADAVGAVAGRLQL